MEKRITRQIKKKVEKEEEGDNKDKRNIYDKKEEKKEGVRKER